MAAVPEAKQSNQNVLSFQLGFVQPFIPPELGAAGILEAPIFSSKIGSGGAHEANRFLARLFFSGLFERLLFFVLGDSQAGFRVQGLYKLYTVQVRSFERVSVLTFDLYNLYLSGLEGYRV